MKRKDSYGRMAKWKEILWNAGATALRDLQIVRGWGLIVSTLVFLIYLFLVWKVFGWVDASAELKEKALWTVAPLMALPVCFLFRLLTTIPDREIDLEKRVMRLKIRLTPRFEVGTIRQTFKSQSGLERDFLCLTVKNVSEVGSDVLGAQIVELRSDHGRAILDPVQLQWMGGNHDQSWGQIPSNATRTVKVFELVEGQIRFNMEVLPRHYADLLEGAKTLKGKIALDDRYWGGQYVHFEAHCGQENPRLDVVQTDRLVLPNQWDTEDGQCDDTLKIEDPSRLIN